MKRKLTKFYLILQVCFGKTKDDQVKISEPYFHRNCHIVLNNEDNEGALRMSIMTIFNAFIKYQIKCINWTLEKVANKKKTSSTSKIAIKSASIMRSVLVALYLLNNDPNRGMKYAFHKPKRAFISFFISNLMLPPLIPGKKQTKL